MRLIRYNKSSLKYWGAKPFWVYTGPALFHSQRSSWFHTSTFLYLWCLMKMWTGWELFPPTVLNCQAVPNVINVKISMWSVGSMASWAGSFISLFSTLLITVDWHIQPSNSPEWGVFPHTGHQDAITGEAVLMSGGSVVFSTTER